VGPETVWLIRLVLIFLHPADRLHVPVDEDLVGVALWECFSGKEFSMLRTTFGLLSVASAFQ